MLRGLVRRAGRQVTLDLRQVDSAVAELGDPQMIAALAMRKLQALHLLATPGVRTTTDVVVAIVNDLERALVQAPNMRLKRQARDDGLGRGVRRPWQSGDLAREAERPRRRRRGGPGGRSLPGPARARSTRRCSR